MLNFNTAHSVAPNSSPHIRYVVYFRVHSVARPEGVYYRDAIRNIWADWPNMAPLLALGPAPPRPTATADQEVASLSQQAEAHFAAKEWGEAWPLYERISQLRPNVYAALLKMAIALIADRPMDSASHGKASAALERACAIRNDLAAPMCGLARVRALQGRQDDALRLAQSALTEPGSYAGKEDILILVEGLKYVPYNSVTDNHQSTARSSWIAPARRRV